MLQFFKIKIFIGLLILVSCTPNSVIPKKELVPILVKICLTDATVACADYNLRLSNNDTIEYYAPIIESFGFSIAQFDSTLSYYSKNPKEFDAIYDKVIFELSKMETKLNEGIKKKTDSLASATLINIWNLKNYYEQNLSDPQNVISFEIPVIGIGAYTLSYDIQVFPDDESVEPGQKIYFFFDDKTESGDVSQYLTKTYTKDGVKREVTTQMNLNNSNVTHIKGYLLDYNSTTTSNNYKNHAIISNIKLLYTPFDEKPKRLLKVDKELKTE